MVATTFLGAGRIGSDRLKIAIRAKSDNSVEDPPRTRPGREPLFGDQINQFFRWCRFGCAKKGTTFLDVGKVVRNHISTQNWGMIPHHSKWIPHLPKWIPHLPKWIPQPCEPTPGPRLEPAAARWYPGGIKNQSFAATQDRARAPLPVGSDSFSCRIANLFLKNIDFEKK